MPVFRLLAALSVSDECVAGLAAREGYALLATLARRDRAVRDNKAAVKLCCATLWVARVSLVTVYIWAS